MKLLLDSHAVIWAVNDPASLGARAKIAREDLSNQLAVSAATIWEIAIKVGLKKLDLKRPYQDWMQQAVIDLGLELLYLRQVTLTLFRAATVRERPTRSVPARYPAGRSLTVAARKCFGPSANATISTACSVNTN